tara:strand:- start:5661 stop:7520 length:1860 start_codon:yes stop_codon:yes gene_type:complete
VAQSNVKLTVDGSQATRALKNVQGQTNALQKSVKGLQAAFAGVGLTFLAKKTILAATNFEKLNQRLKILTKENGTYSQSLKLAEEAQTKFGLSTTDALEGVTNLQARLGPLGSTMDEITAIFNGFNTAAILSGASAQEQAGAMRQLTQALGSGVLRGDEFNSISEQMSAVLKPIADQLGVNVGALRDMAAEGKITKDVVVAAFKEIEKEGSKALKQLIKNDPTMVFKVLSNETEKLSIAVGNLLAPAVLDAVRLLTQLTKSITDFMASPIVQTAAIFAGIALAIKGVTAASALLSAAQTMLVAKFALTSAGAIAMAKAQATASLATKALAISTGALTIALNALPLVALVTLLGLATTAVIKHKKAQADFNKVVTEGSGQQVNELLKEQRTIQEELTKKLEKANGRQKQGIKNRLAEVNADIALLEGRSKTLEKEKEITEEKKKQEEINKKIKETQTEQQKQAEELKEAYKRVGDSIATNIRDSLVEAVKGTKTLGEMATSILNDIADAFLRIGITQALKSTGLGIFSGLGFANGGRPPVGKASIVGERGPELFVPSVGGTIVPNHNIGGGDNIVNISVDARGSQVEGSDTDAKQLGLAIANAVQQQLVKEQRPGGLLSA